MKAMKTIAAFALAMLPLLSISQERSKDSLVLSEMSRIGIMKMQGLTPGDELYKGMTHYYTGLGMMIAGTAILGYTSLIKEDITPEGHKVATVVCGGLALAGAILQIESMVHIGRAGVLLNYNGVGVSMKLKEAYKYKSRLQMKELY
jgi:hypothetical protein